MSIRNKILKNITLHYRKQAQYFSNCKKHIAKTNLKLLKNVCIMTSCVIVALNCITPLILPNWKFTLAYALMPFAPLPFYVFAVLYKKKKVQKSPFTTSIIACLLFYIGLILYLIYISTFNINARFTSQIYISLAFMVVPAIFIIPQTLITLLLLASSTLFLFLSYQYKPITIFREDFFSIIATLLFSHGTAFFVWTLRLSENNTRQKLEYLSRIDSLTGILNKGTFEDECRSYFTLRKEQDSCALFIIDLDNFKSINDTFGHIIGDELLDSFGHNLLHVFRLHDVIGRIGGDEFCVLIKNSFSQELIQKKTSEIKQILKSMLKDSLNFTATCSIGVATHNNGFISYLDLLKKADMALYQAKNTGKDSCIIFKESSCYLINQVQ